MVPRQMAVDVLSSAKYLGNNLDCSFPKVCTSSEHFQLPAKVILVPAANREAHQEQQNMLRSEGQFCGLESVMASPENEACMQMQASENCITRSDLSWQILEHSQAGNKGCPDVGPKKGSKR